MRAKRCPGCQQRFYDATGTAKECQNCAGTHDPSAQIAADEAAVKRVNSRKDAPPQTIDPRTGEPPKPKPAKGAKK